MQPSDMQVPPSADWQAFERHLYDIYQAEWGASVKLHGRTGQPQCGVDVYGQPHGEQYWGIQCKRHDAALNAAVTESELRGEIAKARGFKPKLARFILATTAPRDVKIQAVVRRLNERKRKPFSVEVLFWDDVLALYGKHPAVFRRHYPFIAPATAPHTLRPPVADFTGRSDELAEIVAAAQRGATISGMRGQGGVGKTELALAAAEALDGRFPDGQILVALRGTDPKPLSAADALAAVISRFEPDVRLPEDAGQLQAIYLSLLHDKKVLVLADNARDAAQVRPLLPPDGCLLLVTSRTRFTLPGLKAIDLDCLAEPEAAELLQKICPLIGGQAAAIAQKCGRLPLALRAAASFLEVRSDIDAPKYLRELEDEVTRLEKIGAEGVEIGVEASLNLSYRQLPAETQRVFRALAVFPADFDAAAAVVVCGDEGNAQLGTLFRYSLVEFGQQEGRYRLHDLTRLFAAARLDDPAHGGERLPAEERHAAHFCGLVADGKELYEKGNENIAAALGLFDRERANIEAAQAWSARHAATSDAAARLANDYPRAGAYVLELRLHPRQRIGWLLTAVAAARRLKHRGAEGGHLGNLGSAYAALGEPHKAIDFHEQALVICREIGDRRGEGHDLNNLGVVYADLGDARRAIEFFENALVVSREIGDRHGEGSALGNLGLAYVDLREPRKAIEFYDQVLAIHREIGDRGGEGKTLGNLGVAYADLGEPRTAIEFYEQDLVIAREIGDRRGEGSALGNVGLAYAALGEARKARECYEQALPIHREIGDRLGQANDCWNLGVLLGEQGERERGLALADAYVDYLRELGHPDAEKRAAQVEELRRKGQK